ncbi:hypothetical protein ROT00_14235 [Agromyces mediolanus]|uniref:hypothetical protein n=1 Tax=Agromyces mediolanus TaxID=41986 RepID=UPI0038324C8E
MIEVEDSDVAFAAIDARVRQQMLPHHQHRRTPGLGSPADHELHMLVAMLAVVPLRPRTIAGTADVLEAVAGGTPHVELGERQLRPTHRAPFHDPTLSATTDSPERPNRPSDRRAESA